MTADQIDSSKQSAYGRPMLISIQADLGRLCRIMSTVTGVDIEIVNRDMVRVAGTGIYAAMVGQSIGQAGNIYKKAFSTGKTVYIDNPGENAICHDCEDRDNCREQLNLCTPILLEGEIIGVIGLVCFTEGDKSRVKAQYRVFSEFVEQAAQVISSLVDQKQHAKRVNQMLDALLQVTDDNSRGIMILNRAGAISYTNTVARQEFSLDSACAGTPVTLRDAGNAFADLREYDVRIGEAEHCTFGRHMLLDSPEEFFSSVLFTEPLPRFTEIFSQAGGSTESPTRAYMARSPACSANTCVRKRSFRSTRRCGK